jgi:hypothetical protein
MPFEERGVDVAARELVGVHHADDRDAGPEELGTLDLDRAD